MTKWWYMRCDQTKDPMARNDDSNWEDADPAADPEVQARVLRAYAKEVDRDLWPHEIAHGDYARSIADDLESAKVKLPVEEAAS